jgi:hypothetical protein
MGAGKARGRKPFSVAYRNKEGQEAFGLISLIVNLFSEKP